MPIFTVPMHEPSTPLREFNDCHVPAGSPDGGQFCGKGAQYTVPFAEPTARRDNPYFPTTSAGSLTTRDVKHYGSGVHNAQTLADWAAEQMATSLGVPEKKITIADVPTAEDIFGHTHGGFVAPDRPGLLYLTDRSQRGIEKFFMGDKTSYEATEGVKVLLHELVHYLQPALTTSPTAQELAATDPDRAWTAHGLDEGVAMHLGNQLFRRLTGKMDVKGPYGLQQAIIRRMERRAGHNFIRALYRAPTAGAFADLIYDRFPKTRGKPGPIMHYAHQMMMGGQGSQPDAEGFKEILKLFN